MVKLLLYTQDLVRHDMHICNYSDVGVLPTSDSSVRHMVGEPVVLTGLRCKMCNVGKLSDDMRQVHLLCI